VLLPDVLGRDLVEQYFERLQAEWRPATPTETFLVREMARHGVALERTEQMENPPRIPRHASAGVLIY
jgi:hypothetical protein